MTAVSVHRIDEPHDVGQSPKLLPHVFNPADGEDGSDVDANRISCSFEGLHPGERYYYSVVVVTPDGRWDDRIGEFTTKRRENNRHHRPTRSPQRRRRRLRRARPDTGSRSGAGDNPSTETQRTSTSSKSSLSRAAMSTTGQKIQTRLRPYRRSHGCDIRRLGTMLAAFGAMNSTISAKTGRRGNARPIPRGVNETVTDEEFFVPCLSWDGDPLIFKVHARWSVDDV